MSKILKDKALEQLQVLIAMFEDLKRRGGLGKSFPELDNNEYQTFLTRAQAAVENIAGKGSVHAAHASRIAEREDWPNIKALDMGGVIMALHQDVEAGSLESIEELARGAVFTDFLEMAGYLLEQEYKDAAAVIASGALEAHLRQLAQKFEIDLQIEDKPKKLDLLNADLFKKGAYSLIDQKNVTAWLGLRNNAAHGEYDKYSKDQVALFVDNIRGFVQRNPA